MCFFVKYAKSKKCLKLIKRFELRKRLFVMLCAAIFGAASIAPMAMAKVEKTTKTDKASSSAKKEKKEPRYKKSDSTSKSTKGVKEATSVSKDKNKKSEKKSKSPKNVRTTVIQKPGTALIEPRSKASFGAALGLSKHVDELNLKSSVAMIVDQKSGDVLFEKNPDTVLPIASITKLMTAMVVLDAKQPLDEMLEINDEDARIYKPSRLTQGTDLSRREALLLALMSSENRAAYTLGRNYPGGIAAFIPAMNRKAREIGMSRSRFADPTGLTNQNAASAEDLSRLVNAAYQYPLIREYSTHMGHSKIINGRTQEFVSSNRLVRSGDMEIGLQKTGYIADAGRCLVMQASVKGKPVIMVFLDSAGKLSRFADAVRVKEWIEESSDLKPLRRVSLDRQG
jgi:D-alanyl-D-alanine endopeptidase (penicillin-binding protein 7)